MTRKRRQQAWQKDRKRDKCRAVLATIDARPRDNERSTYRNAMSRRVRFPRLVSSSSYRMKCEFISTSPVSLSPDLSMSSCSSLRPRFSCSLCRSYRNVSTLCRSLSSSGRVRSLSHRDLHLYQGWLAISKRQMSLQVNGVARRIAPRRRSQLRRRMDGSRCQYTTPLYFARDMNCIVRYGPASPPTLLGRYHCARTATRYTVCTSPRRGS